MKSVYLAGSMSGLKNFGAGWRREIQKWLEAQGEKVFNPVLEEGDKPNPDWESLDQGFQEAIIKKDLNQVINFTKYIICYYTQPSTGTVTELGSAFYHGIPILFVSSGAIQGWPGSISRASSSKVFKSFKALKSYLSKTIYKSKIK